MIPAVREHLHTVSGNETVLLQGLKLQLPYDVICIESLITAEHHNVGLRLVLGVSNVVKHGA